MLLSSTVRRSGLTLACAFACLASAGYSQGHPGGGGPGGPGGGGMGGGMGGISRPDFPGRNTGTFPGDRSGTSPRIDAPPGTPPNGKNPTDSTMLGGLQLGPSGRGWDDSSFARSLGIDSKQQHRMDDVFSSNRGTLLKLYKNLQHEEKELAKTIRSKELDEAQIFQQIDRVTQARGELEKANAHMLLQIRKEMSPEQTSKLDEHRPELQ